MRGPKRLRYGAELNQLNIITDGSLLVRDGVVAEVGTTRRLENLKEARDAIEIEAAGRVVMPGFVDSHTHLLFPPPGTPAGNGLSAAGTLQGTTSNQLKMRATRYLQAMARHGTTTVEVKTGSGADPNSELKLLRVLAELNEGWAEVVPSFLLRQHRGGEHEGPPEDRAHVTEELLPRIAKRRLAGFADLGWDDSAGRPRPGAPNGETWPGAYFKAANRLGFRCRIHAEGGPVSSAVDAVLEHQLWGIDHIESAEEPDIACLARSGAIATLLPCASFHSGGRFEPARKLIDAGTAIALASNFNARETPSLNMQTAVALACSRMGLTPAEAISASTINAAYALDRGTEIGSLECGKRADVLLLNVSDYRDLGDCLGTNLVHTVMKHGEVIYEEGSVQPRPAEDLQPAW